MLKVIFVVATMVMVAGMAPGCGPANSGRDMIGIEGQGGAGLGDDTMGGDGDGFGNSGGLTDPNTDQETIDGGCEVGSFCERTAADDNNCGSLELEADVETIEEPGNVLIIFDRSGSMDQAWNGTVKWQLAGQAVIDALTPIADLLTVGAVFFPSPDAAASMPATCAPSDWLCNLTGGGGFAGTCGVNPMASADQITFKPGPEFLTEFAGDAAANIPPKYQPVAGGRTPLYEGVVEGDAALAGSALTGGVAVVVITDGQPNCMWDAAGTNGIVANWLGQGITTHVVGLPGAGGAAGLLDAVATAGGTLNHITPTDSQVLANELNTIVRQTVSMGFKECQFELKPAATVPDDLHLVATEAGVEHDVPRDLGASGGWNITGDGITVTLEGNLCDQAKAGLYTSITFEYGCVELPPLDPPPPVILD